VRILFNSYARIVLYIIMVSNTDLLQTRYKLLINFLSFGNVLSINIKSAVISVCLLKVYRIKTCLTDLFDALPALKCCLGVRHFKCRLPDGVLVYL
jgi:hypothetical protein